MYELTSNSYGTTKVTRPLPADRHEEKGREVGREKRVKYSETCLLLLVPMDPFPVGVKSEH